MATNIPLNTPLQQQIDEFIAGGQAGYLQTCCGICYVPSGSSSPAALPRTLFKEGEQAPDFTLPDARGNAVRLSHLLRQGPVVISFYRGQWCPYCHLVLRAYQQAVPQLQVGRATLVAISPQTLDHSKALAEKLELTFALLSDMGNQVAREYGLAFTIDKAVRRAHLQVGADLPAFNGTDTWDLPMAGTFLVDRSGTVRLAFVDPDFTRRLDPSVIVARLNKLRS